MDEPCKCPPFNWHREIRCIVPGKGGIYKVRTVCLSCKQATKWTWEKENR